ncbi:MAG: HEAT repeat domain-containing protein, partial [Moorea sp. SIO2B7]|nr:HEAT repeat domain-containing protein [Moorena sp. SIO2B7]
MPHRGNLNRPKLFPTFNTSITQCLCYFLALLVAVLLIVNGSHAEEKKPELESWQLKGIVAALDDHDPLVWAEALNKLSSYKLDQLKPPIEISNDRIHQIAELLTYDHETEHDRKSVQSRVHASAAKALGEIGPAAYKYAPQISELLTDSNSYVLASAAYALGQMGAPASEYASQIAKLLKDSDRNVSRSAAKALRQMGVAKDYAPQIAKRLTDLDSDVRSSAAEALGQMGVAKDYASQILPLLTHSDWNVRYTAAYALGQMGAAASEYFPQILLLLTHSDWNVRYTAAYALGQMGAIDIDKDIVHQISQFLTDSNSDFRSNAAEVLGQIGPAASDYAPQIAERLTDKDSNVRYSAAYALGQMGAAAYKYAPQIIPLLTDSDDHIPNRAASALGQMGTAASQYVPQIIPLLTDSDDHVRSKAAYTLARMGVAPSEIAPEILELLTDSDSYMDDVAHHAAYALGQMGAAESKYAPQIAKLLIDSNNSLVRDSAAKALERMAPLEIKNLLSVLNQVYWYQLEAPRLRFLAYFLSGGEENLLVLIHWLGSPKEYPHENEDHAINHQEGVKVLELFAEIWEPSKSFDYLHNDLQNQIAVVVNQVSWKQTDIDLLKKHYKNLKSINSQVAAVAVNAKILALEGQHWFLIAFKIWLIHVSGWLFLIIIYPRSAQVQSLIWNRRFRTIVGLGYITVALTWIPQLRYRLLAPFREVLVADASLDSFDPQAYFPNSHVKIRRATHTQPIQTAIAQLQSPIVLEGESGLGKSMFLRNLVKTSGRLSVYLPASQCAGGVVEGIQAKLPIAADDPLFLQSLINYNTLDICIDGLNEVSPDTRAT